MYSIICAHHKTASNRVKEQNPAFPCVCVCLCVCVCVCVGGGGGGGGGGNDDVFHSDTQPMKTNLLGVNHE